MNATAAIGAKVKELRAKKKMTLKQLSEASGLSIGFLSQFERGLSSIALDSLDKLADVLEVPLSAFFEGSSECLDDPVMRTAEIKPSVISAQVLQHLLIKPDTDFAMLPRVLVLMPFTERIETADILHTGEEFIFVLEGMVTFLLDKNKYVLYPGDSIHIHSNQQHNWMNTTAHLVRMLMVNMPNPLGSVSVPETAETESRDSNQDSVR